MSRIKGIKIGYIKKGYEIIIRKSKTLKNILRINVQGLDGGECWKVIEEI